MGYLHFDELINRGIIPFKAFHRPVVQLCSCKGKVPGRVQSFNIFLAM
uniref:Uncharacterized protein n=1 Tax=Ficus carica TaxID=3494 RepID=A0AA88EJD1_FICCA|nr:hypothetical protein TIFTF001_056610 [Ficus carica]